MISKKLKAQQNENSMLAEQIGVATYDPKKTEETKRMLNAENLDKKLIYTGLDTEIIEAIANSACALRPFSF